jgi:hypothetical protein
MRVSQSLQSATPDAPRAIVFGKDGKFTLTFNGNPGQAGFNSIEMMQFLETTPTTGRFELQEIEFSENGTEPARISPLNPPKCSRCHGTDPKPLWEEYDRWPGAYGEEDDALIDFDDTSRFPTTADGDNKLVARHRQHLREFRNFLASRSAHPRYRWLRFPQDTDSPVAPYIPTIRSGSDPLRPNLRLTKLFSELNARRIVRKLTESGDQCFKVAGPVAVALFLDCDSIDATRPSVKSLQLLLRDAESEMRQTQPPAIQPALFSIRNPSMFKDGRIYILQLMGVSDFDWTPARLKRQWQYFQGFKDTSDDILSAMWPELKARGFELEPYEKIRAELYPSYYSYSPKIPSGHPTNNYANHDGMSQPTITARESACKQLTRNFETTNAIQLTVACTVKTPTNDLTVPAVIKMCMSCHDGNSLAPKLPLDNPTVFSADAAFRGKLLSRLNASDPELRMPPDRPLSPTEWRDLTRFLLPNTP